MRVAARREEQLCAADGSVELTLVELDGAAREEAEHRPLLGRRRPLERTNPVADGLPRHRLPFYRSRAISAFQRSSVPAAWKP